MGGTLISAVAVNLVLYVVVHKTDESKLSKQTITVIVCLLSLGFISLVNNYVTPEQFYTIVIIQGTEERV